MFKKGKFKEEDEGKGGQKRNKKRKEKKKRKESGGEKGWGFWKDDPGEKEEQGIISNFSFYNFKLNYKYKIVLLFK